MTTEVAEKIWGKILSAMGSKPHLAGRAGCIPVYDGTEWRVFRNALTIYPGAENCADPAKVDLLRQNANDLFDHYPQTLVELEKLGGRFKRLLKKPHRNLLKTSAPGPTLRSTLVRQRSSWNLLTSMTLRHLAYEDFNIEVKSTKSIVLCDPGGSERLLGVNETL